MALAVYKCGQGVYFATLHLQFHELELTRAQVDRSKLNHDGSEVLDKFHMD
jgi:hypothetical protein